MRYFSNLDTENRKWGIAIFLHFTKAWGEVAQNREVLYADAKKLPTHLPKSNEMRKSRYVVCMFPYIRN